MKQFVDMPAITAALKDPELIRIVETTRSLPTGWEGHHICRIWLSTSLKLAIGPRSRERL
ncbi:hypothetical protein [Geomonas agri]|uniref:hypothetical protein n=1 Tax=Geomonas agri TaxID=2873702 RepID=UPI001CD35781|nr:hypothetical protein [Geomonas agri]